MSQSRLVICESLHVTLREVRQWQSRANFCLYVLYCLGEGGQEHLQHLTRRDVLDLHTDSDGMEFYCLPPLPSKNESADPVRSKPKPDNKQARIYDTEKVRRHLDLLPAETKYNHLFPRPLANFANGSPTYSTTQNRGVNYLVRFMHNLREKAGLSKMYSNHCIRVTRITDLEAAGHSMADNMSITGRGHLHEVTFRSIPALLIFLFSLEKWSEIKQLEILSAKTIFLANL